MARGENTYVVSGGRFGRLGVALALAVGVAAGGAWGDCTPRTMPLPPSGVTAEHGVSCVCVNVTWEAAPGVTGAGYRVWRSNANDLSSVELIADQHIGLMFADEGAPAGVEVVYWVQTMNDELCSSELSVSDVGMRRPERPTVVGQPRDVVVGAGGVARFDVVAWDASSVEWRRDGERLVDGGGLRGSGTAELVIEWAGPEHVGYYDAVVSNECGMVETVGAALVVGGQAPCSVCVADYDGNGGVDAMDVEQFFADWSAGAGCSDVNRDGGIDGGDVDTFIGVWSGGAC